MSELQELETRRAGPNGSFWRKLFRRRKDDRLKLNDARTGKDVQRVVLGSLARDRKWYARRSEFNYRVKNVLVLLSIVFATSASILTAVYDEVATAPAVWLLGVWEVDARTLLIVLPALSALCGTLLVQFRFQEACRIRDQGRITTEKLINRAYLIPIEDHGAALEEAISIRNAVSELEEDQLAQITGSDRPPLRSNGSTPPA